MRIKFISSFLFLFLLISTSFANEHYISDVTGLTPEGTIPIDGSTVTFTIGLNNTGPENLTGITNGFRIYSNTGAEWTTTVGVLTGTITIGMLESTFVNPFSDDGVGADTIGFGGFRLFAPGIPVGDIPDVWTITIGPVDAAYNGGEICIDSSYYPPAGAWTWSVSTGDLDPPPGWAGPSCYTIGEAVENAPPVLAPIGNHSADENVNINFTITATDADGDPLTYSMTSPDLPIEANFNPGTRTFDWTPGYTDAGVYSATFTVTDGTDSDQETISITVNDVNIPPVLDPIGNQAVDENENLNFVVTGSDPESDPITISISSTNLPPGYTFDGSVFDWTPSFDDAGVYSVTFRVSDGMDIDEETITITVFNVNRPPVVDPGGDKFTDENVNLYFEVVGTDPDADALTFSISTTDLPGGYTFNAAGQFDWTPTFNDAGVYSVTFQASDGLAFDEETITITVNDINQAPILNPIGNKATNEEQLLQFNVSASDLDGDAVTISMVAPTLPPAATFDGAQFNWTPAVGEAGVYSVEFIASDGSLEDSETIQITVNSSNQPPYYETIPEFVVLEGETIVGIVQAYDPNGDDLTVWLDPVLPNMSYADLGGGMLEITFSPNCSQSGEYVLSAYAADGEFTVSADIDFVVTEACEPTEAGIVIIEPDPVKAIYAHLIDQMDAVIYFGNLSGGFNVTDVDLGALLVNGLMPGMVAIEPSHPLFDGEVLRIEVSMVDFIHYYPALFDTSLQIYSLTGSFIGGAPIDVNGEFTFIGKLLGDVNLDGIIDISDITYLISFFFHNGMAPMDIGTADFDGDGFVGIVDLSELINMLFHH